MLQGTWGTASQCQEAVLVEGGTFRAKPFIIDEEWLQHGEIWCRLDWIASEARPDGAYASARARCGEDAVRTYVLRLLKKGDDLTLMWDENVVNEGLRSCPNLP